MDSIREDRRTSRGIDALRRAKEELEQGVVKTLELGSRASIVSQRAWSHARLCRACGRVYDVECGMQTGSEDEGIESRW